MTTVHATNAPSHAATQSAAQSAANVKTICAVVFLIGASLVFLVGFSNTSAMHNAAHDTRHGLSFPCH